MSQNEPKSNDAQKIENLSFEDALAQLERVVRSLDAGQSSLETSLADYERGVKLFRHCHAALQNAERRIEILKNVSPDGSLTTEIASENQFLTDAAKPGQYRGGQAPVSPSADPDGSLADAGESETSEKTVRKKRVRKTAQDDNFDKTSDISFDF